MKSLQIDFTDKEITPWGGLALLKQMLDKIDFESVLRNADLPVQGSNRGYPPEQLITNFLVGVWCGAKCIEHMEVTRHDHTIGKLFGWNHMPGHRAFKRYFQKFNQGINQQVFTTLYQWFFNNLHLNNYTLDFDSSVLTRYGTQQGAKRGYNPRKPGRASHHPLMAFVAECRMVANCWLRPGDSYTTNNFLSFLEDTFQKLQGKKISLVRADSGFYSKEVFDYLEQEKLPYVIACKFYHPIKMKLVSHRTWLKLDEGIEIAETLFQAEDWKAPRRLVMVRQQINKRPKAAGKQLRLFEEEGIYKDYRYSCFVTNLEFSAKMVYALYRNRADAENRIKELNPT